MAFQLLICTPAEKKHWAAKYVETDDVPPTGERSSGPPFGHALPEISD
ncbi:MAG: hypothetical protein R2747_14050 [Pyrinomonadaceae bacterium]